MSNDSDFGLRDSVWTQDAARGMRIASRTEGGTVSIHNIDWADADLPLGSIKKSGYVRELGNMGIPEFVNKKLITTGHLPALV